MPLNPQSRLAILQTLSTFLHTSLSPSADSELFTAEPWYLATSFDSARDYATFLQGFTSDPVLPPVATWIDSMTFTDPEYAEDFDLAFSWHQNPDLSLETLEIPFASTSNLGPIAITSVPNISLLGLLHPTLLSAFLDSAPSALSPTAQSTPGSDSHLSTIVATISIARELFWAELGGLDGQGGERGLDKEREGVRKLLVTFLTHVGVYFPFGGDELEKRSKDVS